MAKVYISEYAVAALDSRGMVSGGQEPALANQVLDTAATHLSAAFNAETRFVRVHTDGIVSYLFGTAPTAATTNARMAANQTEYFGVPKGAPGASSGYKLDVIANT